MEWRSFGIVLSVLFQLFRADKVVNPDDKDILQPYEEPHHGPQFHTHFHIKALQPLQFNNVTSEIYPADSSNLLKVATFEAQHFIKEVGYESYVLGHKFTVRNPHKTLSILEPQDVGGCANRTLSTVRETAQRGGCILATNAGFYNTKLGSCNGDVVSNGRFVQHIGLQNVHFGIRKDGSLFFGYIPEDLDIEKEFDQLVSGVIWLIRDGQNFIGDSMRMEASSTQETGSLSYFVSVKSGRLAVGNDKQGRVIVVQVDGRTGQRGVSLYELTEILLGWGVVNAVNLDGGGSVTAVVNDTLINYPSDTCDSGFNCARQVSTVICVHEPQCFPRDCSGHGDCVRGFCHCHGNWVSHDCSRLECEPTNCTSKGVCTQDGCLCNPGYHGANCELVCPSSNFGLNCSSVCKCRNGAKCNPVDGSCVCPAGYTGDTCDQECPLGFYGAGCQQLCLCENSCGCNAATGRCNVSLHSSMAAHVAECLASQIVKTFKLPADHEGDFRIWFLGTVFIACLAVCSIFLNIILLNRLCHNKQIERDENQSPRKFANLSGFVMDMLNDKKSSLPNRPKRLLPKRSRLKCKRTRDENDKRGVNDENFPLVCQTPSQTSSDESLS